MKQPSGVQTTEVNGADGIKLFFDGIAAGYTDQHGNPNRLLRYRIDLLRKLACLKGNEVVLEMCCGTGDHLLALQNEFKKGIGIDFSPEMIRNAVSRISASDQVIDLSFRVDDATLLQSIENESIDVAICVGSLEHIPDKKAVFSVVKQKLKRGGRFVCLTVNGEYVWYSKIAPLLGVSTHHLSTDQFLKHGDIKNLADDSNLRLEQSGYWSFVPRGDMPGLNGHIFQFLDTIGKLCRCKILRGGIFFMVRKK